MIEETKKEEPWGAGIFGCLGVALLIGLLFLAGAWFGVGNSRGLGVQFRSDRVDTTGTVLRGDRYHAPSVRFQAGGRSIVFDVQRSSSYDFHTSDVVPITYLRSDPNVAWVRNFDQQYSVPLLAILFASPFLLVFGRGVQMYVRKRRHIWRAVSFTERT